MTDILALPDWVVLAAERNDDKLVIKAEYRTDLHMIFRRAIITIS